MRAAADPFVIATIAYRFLSRVAFVLMCSCAVREPSAPVVPPLFVRQSTSSPPSEPTAFGTVSGAPSLDVRERDPRQQERLRTPEQLHARIAEIEARMVPPLRASGLELEALADCHAALARSIESQVVSFDRFARDDARRKAIDVYEMLEKSYPLYPRLLDVIYARALERELAGQTGRARRDYESVARSASGRLLILAYFGLGVTTERSEPHVSSASFDRVLESGDPILGAAVSARRRR